MRTFKDFLREEAGKHFGVSPEQFKSDLKDGGHPDYDHLHQGAQEHLTGDVSHIGKEGKHAISRWTQNQNVGYKEINAVKRGMNNSLDAMRITQHLSDAVGGHQLPQSTYAYRGVHGPHAAALNKMKPGDTFHNKGFSSTTLDPKRATHFARGEDMMSVHVPQGHNALYVSHPKLNSWTQERELVLQHGTHFRYKGSEHIESPEYHYTGEPTGKTRKIKVHHVEVVPYQDKNASQIDEQVAWDALKE